MRNRLLYLLLTILLLSFTNITGQGLTEDYYRTTSGNTEYHHFIRNSPNGAAVYINQVNSLASILKLSSGTVLSNQGVKFTFLSNGNFGIGTPSPAAKLNIVNGATIGSSNIGNASILLGSTSLGMGIDSNEIKSNGTDISLGTISNHSIYFKTMGSNKRMVINATGEVGIGTPSPSSTLHVKALVNSINGGITLESNNSTHKWSLDANDAGNFRIYKGTTPIARFNDNGNFGIGTTNPEAKIHIENNNIGVKSTYATSIIESTDAHLDITSSSAATWGSSINFVEGNGNSNTDIWSIVRQTTNGTGDSSLRFNFGTTNSHVNSNIVTYKTDGKVGIGTTNPEAKLHVYDSDANYTDIFLGESTASNKLGLVRYRHGGSIKDVLQLGNWGDNLNTNGISIKKGGNLGIGTNNPTAKLHVNGGIKVGNANPYEPDANFYEDDNYLSFRHNGTSEDFIGYKSNTFYLKDSPGGFDTVDPNLVVGGKISIGTEDTGSHKLAVEGSIGAREIKVEASGWSDFVFEKEYDLPTLAEVEQYIKEKGHLPSIPSAKEVAKNGIFLGEMNSKLLQKIEELTLYTIHQEKKLTEQNEKIKALEKAKQRNDTLEARLEKLEKLLQNNK